MTGVEPTGPESLPARVPVLLITGPVGVGKTTTAGAISWVLTQHKVLHASVDLPAVSQVFPERDDDPWNELLAHRNLACMWQNFRAIGADRLIVTRVLESRTGIRRIEHAVPGAQVVVVRLRAPLETIQNRIRQRDHENPGWFLDAAAYLVPAMDEQHVEDHLIDNTHLTLEQTAYQVLRTVGWLSPVADGTLVCAGENESRGAGRCRPRSV